MDQLTVKKEISMGDAGNFPEEDIIDGIFVKKEPGAPYDASDYKSAQCLTLEEVIIKPEESELYEISDNNDIDSNLTVQYQTKTQPYNDDENTFPKTCDGQDLAMSSQSFLNERPAGKKKLFGGFGGLDGSEDDLDDRDDANDPDGTDDPNDPVDLDESDSTVRGLQDKSEYGDNLLYCYDCGRSWEGECPEHGPLIIVNDSEVLIDVEDIYAIETAPSFLRVFTSVNPDVDASGVFARETLPNRMRFGPMEGKIVSPNVVNSYTWVIHRNGKPFQCVDLSDPSTSCWMRYVRIAQNDQEKNCAAYQFNGRLYFTTIREISSQEEIVVGPYDSNGLLVKYPNLVMISQEIFKTRANHPLGSAEGTKKSSAKKKSYKKNKSTNPTYKYCLVPNCSSTTLSNPRKRFIYLPLDETRRSAWLKAMNYSDKISSKSHHHTICEDHFNLENDAENYMKLRYYPKSKVCLKAEVVPHIFVCRYSRSTEFGICEGDEERTRDEELSQNDNLNTQMPKQFSCTDCFKQFTRKAYLDIHMRTHRTENSFLCSYCHKRFSDEELLNEHTTSHNLEKPAYMCSVCGRSFSHPADLRRHLRIHTGERPFVCSTCNRGFSQKATLHRHLLTHTGEKPHGCNVCGRQFSRKSYLEGHMRVHLTDTNPDAGSVSNQESVANHTKTNNLEKAAYTCAVCSRCFSYPADLKRHLRTHTGEKPFKCLRCKQSFSQKASLNRHLQIHAAEKQYACSVCDQRYSRNEFLTAHMQVHSAAEPYLCLVCRKEYWDEEVFTIHVKTHHATRKPHVCTICKRKYVARQSLEDHMNTHTGDTPYKCAVCKKTFRYRQTLRDHVCDKQLAIRDNLNRHMRTQKGDSALECPVCSDQFPEVDALRIHMRAHAARRGGRSLNGASCPPLRFQPMDV